MGILSPLTPRLLEYTNNEQLPIELKGKVLSTFPVKTKCKNCLNPKQWVTQINKYNERWAYFHRWLSVLLSLTLQESFQSSCILTKKKKKKRVSQMMPPLPWQVAFHLSKQLSGCGHPHLIHVTENCLRPGSPSPKPQWYLVEFLNFIHRSPSPRQVHYKKHHARCFPNLLLFTKFRKISAFIPPGKVNSIPHSHCRCPERKYNHVRARARAHTHTHTHTHTCTHTHHVPS